MKIISVKCSPVSAPLPPQKKTLHGAESHPHREAPMQCVSHHSPSPFFHSFRPFVRIWSVARVRKKYGCFAIYGYSDEMSS